MYDRSSQAVDIDAVRLDMFARQQRLHDTKPLTLIKLIQNTKKKLDTKQAAFGVNRNYVLYTLKVLLANGIDSSVKIALGE